VGLGDGDQALGGEEEEGGEEEREEGGGRKGKDRGWVGGARLVFSSWPRGSPPSTTSWITYQWVRSTPVVE